MSVTGSLPMTIMSELITLTHEVDSANAPDGSNR
jgi:hypothetical protein